MADPIIDNLINPKLKSDMEWLLKSMQEAVNLSNSIQIGASSTKSMKELAVVQEKYNKSVQSQALELKKIEAINQKMATDAQKEIDRQNALKQKAHDKEIKRLNDEAKAQRKIAEEAEKAVQKKNQNVTNFKQATPGSINQLSAANSILNQRLKAVNQTTEEGVIKANRLRSAIDRNQSKITSMGTTADRQRANIGNYASAFDGAKNKLLGLVAGLGLLNIAQQGLSKIVSTTAMFEKFGAVLTNTLGSKDLAQKAMDDLTDWASKTPFEVDKATDSYVKLANSGFIPTMDEMTKLGDLASSRGKDLDQLTEAILDASSGEFERLKEFGIKASKSGDQVAFSFKGIKTTVGNTDAEIRKYILSLGAMNGVQGTMSAVSATLGGKISNMKDSFTSFFKALGERGNSVLSGAVTAFTDITKAVTKFVSIPASEKMENERIQVEMLTKTLINQNAPLAVRNNAYDTLAKIAPSVIEGIDKENVNVQKLNQNLADYNRLQIKAIALKVKQEELIVTGEAEAKALEKVIKKEGEFQTLISKIETLTAQASGMNAGVIGEIANYRISFQRGQIDARTYYENLTKLRSKYYTQSIGLKTQEIDTVDRLLTAQENYKKAQEESARIAQEVADFEARLKMDSKYTPPDTQPTPTPSGGTTKTQKELDEEKLKSMLDLLKQQEEYYKQVSENENKSLMERSMAFEEFTRKRIKQIELQRDFDNKYSPADKVANDLKLLNESNKIKLDADKWYQEESKKQAEKAQAEKEAREKEYRENMFNDSKYENERLLKQNQIITDQLLAENAKMYMEGKKNFKEYEDFKESVAEKSAKEILMIQIQQAESQLNALNNLSEMTQEDSEKMFAIEENLTKLKADLIDYDLQNFMTAHDKKIEKLKEYADQTKEVLGAISAVTDTYFGNQLTQLDEQSKADEIAKQKELDAAGDNTRKKEQIEKKYADKQKKIKQEQDEIEYKRRVAEKAQKLIEMGINIAILVTEQNYVGAIIAGVALAAAAATEIPKPAKYKTGTKNHPGGLATVGDGGRELVKMPDGSTFLADKEITFNAPRGMQVLKNSDTEAVLREAKEYKMQPIDISEWTAEQSKQTKLLKEIAGKQQINRIFVPDNSRRNSLKYN